MVMTIMEIVKLIFPYFATSFVDDDVDVRIDADSDVDDDVDDDCCDSATTCKTCMAHHYPPAPCIMPHPSLQPVCKGDKKAMAK
jgi:hypothetical protein